MKRSHEDDVTMTKEEIEAQRARAAEATEAARLDAMAKVSETLHLKLCPALIRKISYSTFTCRLIQQNLAFFLFSLPTGSRQAFREENALGVARAHP